MELNIANRSARLAEQIRFFHSSYEAMAGHKAKDKEARRLAKLARRQRLQKLHDMRIRHQAITHVLAMVVGSSSLALFSSQSAPQPTWLVVSTLTVEAFSVAVVFS